MMDDDEHARWMGPEDPMKDPKDPLSEAYWAAQKAVGRIVPEGLTLDLRDEMSVQTSADPWQKTKRHNGVREPTTKGLR